MKSNLFLTAVMALSASTATASPSELFLSEYIEGSSNNKALEIANLTDASVDLSDYQIKMYFNGNTSAGLTISLSGVVASGDVHVLAHARAAAEILSVADQTQGSGWFNGDDAIELLKDGVVIDSIGQVGFDPGSQWGSGDQSTKDNTLRRISRIQSGDSNSSDSFDPADEWDGFPQNTFDGLGFYQNDDDGGGSAFICGEAATLISQIQGDGSSTPIDGQSVEVEAIVVGDFQGSDNLRGFFLQEEESDYDSDPKTSEGIFVYDNTFGVDVSLGDRVRVAGKAGEYSGMTQVTNVSNLIICDANNEFPTVEVALPFSQLDAPESLEGMHIEIAQTLTVSENYNLGRYGELVLSNGRLMNPTNVVSPGTQANALQQQNDLNRITLDDGSSRQNPEVIKFPQPELSAFNTARGGDSVSGLVGVMHQAFGAYRIQVTQDPNFSPTNPRSENPPLDEAPLKVASFNVLNYFNGDGEGGGFPTARGADNVEEFERQRAKIIAAISAMDADVIGLMEIENDGFLAMSAIMDLVDGVNQSTGKVFDYVTPDTMNGLLGSDAIAVGIIFDTAKVEQIGVAATLDSGAFAERNRQPLVQSFRELDSNGKFSVVVNHFKSKGSCPSDSNDLNTDQGDGQGCWNAVRTSAAQEIVSWLASNPTGIEDTDSLIIGDLNAYAMEDPIISIEQSGYENLIKKFNGSAGYSYVFFGQAGSLDHALSSQSLTPQVVDTIEWHINTDEPRALDYNIEFKSASQVNSLYSSDQFRASDHDPVIIGLNLKPETDVNNDGRLNIRDAIAVIRHFRKDATGKNRKFDLNQDQRINFRDLILVIRAIHKARRGR